MRLVCELRKLLFLNPLDNRKLLQDELTGRLVSKYGRALTKDEKAAIEKLGIQELKNRIKDYVRRQLDMPRMVTISKDPLMTSSSSLCFLLNTMITLSMLFDELMRLRASVLLAIVC
jgi:hypothetical protein